jgi:putative acetyltransferase
MFAITDDDLTSEETRSLLAIHLAGMHANSPPGAVSALDLSGLRVPGVSVWTARRDGRVAGIAALKRLGAGSGELKSMRTHPDFLRLGVAAALLEHVIAVASAEGLNSLSLETGSGPAFEPALALYRKRGFQNGPPFSDYEKSDFNQFLHLRLS